MNIPMPSEAEKRKSISYIKLQGIAKKENLLTVISDVYRNIGIRNIFFGVGDCMFLAFICVLAAFYISSLMEPQFANSTAIFTAPLFFVTAHFLTAWKDYMSGTSEQKAVCKYKPSHITSFRMLSFSIISILCDIPASFALSEILNSGFIRILLFSLCSLFLYSLVMTVSLLIFKWRFTEYAVPVIWVTVNLIPSINLQKWAELINGTETAVPLILCIVFALLYFIALDLLVKKGERKYAYR